MKQMVFPAAGVFLAAAFVASPVAVSSPIVLSCEQPLGAAVPDAETARKIAAAIITARQPQAKLAKFRLVVKADEDGRGNWLAWQEPSGRAEAGGGGISMRIDRCTGAVSDLHYQR